MGKPASEPLSLYSFSLTDLERDCVDFEMARETFDKSLQRHQKALAVLSPLARQKLAHVLRRLRDIEKAQELYLATSNNAPRSVASS